MKSLQELEADCARWQELGNTLVDLGTRAVDTSRLCDEVGWQDEAYAFNLMAAGIARMLQDTILPAIEAHHVEHLAAHTEVRNLEDGMAS